MSKLTDEWREWRKKGTLASHSNALGRHVHLPELGDALADEVDTLRNFIDGAMATLQLAAKDYHGPEWMEEPDEPDRP